MLEERIGKDYVQAMKERNSVKSSTLNFLRAQLKNVFIEKRAGNSELRSLLDADVITVIKKQIKQRQDSIEQYKKGGREDLASKESAELGILKSYLPDEISETELQEMITAAIRETGAASMKDMGNVMKAVTPKLQGRADNRLVSEMVKQALSHR